MIKVNLLPKEFQEKGKGQDWVVLGYAVVVLLAVIALGAFGVKHRSYKKDLQRKERWSQQLSAIKAKVAQVEQLDAQKNVLNAKKNTVVQLFQGRLLYPKMMQHFYETLPREVWVKDMAATEEGDKSIRIVAFANALSTDSIADWLQTLEGKPERFANITLSAIEVRQPADPKQQATYEFTMTFTYRPPPATGV